MSALQRQMCIRDRSRYDRGGSYDYINCPMNEEQYEAFYEAIINAESAETHYFDKRHDVYEGCMPTVSYTHLDVYKRQFLYRDGTFALR